MLLLDNAKKNGCPSAQKGRRNEQIPKDQVLAIWQAITLLGEADEGCDGTERQNGMAAI
jgi:hypothetical protein